MAEVGQLAVSPAQRRAKLSPLMRAKAEALHGQKVNFCPFGCELGDLDDHGYCRHLVGFTNDGKLYEPMVRAKDGRRVVQCKMVPKYPDTVPTNPEEDIERVPVLERVQADDQLVSITVSSRVYRDVDKDVSEKTKKKGA